MTQIVDDSSKNLQSKGKGRQIDEESNIASINTSISTSTDLIKPVDSSNTTVKTEATNVDSESETINAKKEIINAKKVDDEYQLKAIEWLDPNVGKLRKLKVITQNENGPCPLLALCNVLLLRGDIEIKPYDRPTVTYDFLVELLGDYLLKSVPDGEAQIQKILQIKSEKHQKDEIKNQLKNQKDSKYDMKDESKDQAKNQEDVKDKLRYQAKDQNDMKDELKDQAKDQNDLKDEIKEEENLDKKLESSTITTTNYINKESSNNVDSEQLEDNNHDQSSKEDIIIGKTPEITRPSLQDYHHTLNTALSIIPSLQTGLDVNVRFNTIHGFEPTAELSVFDVFDVDLVHGWVIDPQEIDFWDVVVVKCGSYNKAVECVVRGDSVSKGVVVESSGVSGSDRVNNDYSGYFDDNNDKNLDTDDKNKIRDALITSQFLESTATQLTYHGLLSLSETLPPGHICVLFRNNHFSTLYKHPKTLTLYVLVTDAGFVNERTVVWESLIDVDQSSSEFVNAHFEKCEAVGGDYVDVDDNNHNDSDVF
ncbi:6886_t:CDS:2, partial [Entrophospora sp. SA101]